MGPLDSFSNNLIYHDIAVIQWIISCHKNYVTTCVKPLWPVHIMLLTTSVSTMRYFDEIMIIVTAMKYHMKKADDKQNLTLVVIFYEIYETCQRLVS